MSNTRLFGVTGRMDIGVLTPSEHNSGVRSGFTHLDQKITFLRSYENVVGEQPNVIEGLRITLMIV